LLAVDELIRGGDKLSIKEVDLAILQKQVRANSLATVIVTIDLYLYKAHIAQRRWGTPGGNDVALQHYDRIRTLVERTDWPVALAEKVATFRTHLDRFHAYLKAMDVTRVSSEATRLANAFESLREGLETWSSSGA
jgi:hypothetical protein